MNKIKKVMNFAAVLLLVFIYSFSYLPIIVTIAGDDSNSDFIWPTGPSVYADAAIVMEASTGMILYEKDIYSTYYPASITKIMTALLALENCNLNETVTMSHEAEWDVDFNSSRIGLVEGEQLSLKDALYAVMLESANEVSYGVGEHVANGGITIFSEMMNARIAELGGVNTNFTNPHGLHDNNHYTCAYDMALISKAAIAIPEFRTITGTRTYQIPPTNKNVLRYLANHHRFIRKTINYDGAIGGKTGGTAEAKTTLVTFAERDGLLLIAVVLHVDTGIHAYEDTAAILDFGFQNFSSYSIEKTELKDVATFPSLFDYAPRFTKGIDPLIQVSKSSNVILPKTANFEDAKKSITLIPVEEYVHGDNVIGKISYTFEGKYVGFADIVYYNNDYPLTRAEFAERWPSYLIHPNDIIEGTEENETGDKNVNEVQASLDGFVGNDISEKENMSSRNYLPIILGIIVAVIVILIGLYVIFVEIPHKKRRRAYKIRHKERLESIRASSNEFE